MSEIADAINRMHRRVGTRQVETGEAHTVLLRRTYDAEIADVWDAVTSPERIARWFMPVSGELKVGGRYQLEGNAGGEILECVEPERLRVSWLYGPDPGFSEVEVRLTAEDGERTVLELEHVAVVPDDFWDQFGPGAVGVGWDLGLYGLALHLAGGGLDKEEAATWHTTPEGSAFITGSGEGWGEAYAASGADQETAARTAAATIAFYTGTGTGTGA
ncbi:MULTISPECIES: SRPBCC family protein [Streptomyces]|uniref:Aha1 domain-containing protein n=1 Tax=Streptomyces sviceus (strain ATCC 29083 / DSM 924 / JCM 4929 / NBRC 13980 / NCIMB 11184 / NRRL 5439 / UC 5370) TaxID=463191 RepID=B5I455_STRX2|nr:MULTISPECIES: SRPBCC family protein [Streptomyces]EDY59860.1 Aha1 domain-containing protein [Streptomyces sviceus ATCC 29083]MYT10367.1 polyketide cyclase [Streptomyces sp. SID5470]